MYALERKHAPPLLFENKFAALRHFIWETRKKTIPDSPELYRLVEVRGKWPFRGWEEKKRSKKDYGFPAIGASNISDPFRSMANGKTYYNKSDYRADLRAHGMIEVGNEKVEGRFPQYDPGPKLKEQLHKNLNKIQPQ